MLVYDRTVTRFFTIRCVVNDDDDDFASLPTDTLSSFSITQKMLAIFVPTIHATRFDPIDDGSACVIQC